MDFWEFILQPAVLWFVIGLVLLLMEFGIPGLIVIFFGIGAWVTGLTVVIFDPGLNIQLIVFILSSVLSLILLRKYFKKIFVGETSDNVDDTVEEFIGKRAVANSDITPSKPGKVIFKGVQWEAESEEEISKGDSVTIIDKESIVFKVKGI